MRAAAVFVLLLSACGGTPVGDNAGVTENQLERLSRPKVEPVVDPQLSARPQPLAEADLLREGMARPACDFRDDGHVLLAVTSGDAIARINGRLFHFTHSSPIGPTGGFFEDRQISISIGRTTEIEPGGGNAGRWPARIMVTNRRDRAQVEIEGVWRCGA